MSDTIQDFKFNKNCENIKTIVYFMSLQILPVTKGLYQLFRTTKDHKKTTLISNYLNKRML